MAKQKKASAVTPPPKTVWYLQLIQWLTTPFVSLYNSARTARNNASHRSFSLTKKRDVPVKPPLEGYIPFTTIVFQTLWQSKGLFGRFLVLYFFLALAMVGLIQGSNLSSLNDTIDEAGQSGLEVLTQPVTRAFVVVTSSFGGALDSNLSEIQQFYMLALYIFVALITIWLLRQRMAGKKVTLRDGLYSAGAPLVALYVLVIVAVLQLVPAALAVLAYSSVVSGGLLVGGIEAAMFSVALFFIIVLTLYFLLTTLFAFMIATIPGTYPLKAYRIAKKIVTGQRVRLLMRLFWLALVIALIWYVVLIPIAIIVNALSLNDSSVIPVAVQLTKGFLLIYGASYCYLLYRKMINDPTAS